MKRTFNLSGLVLFFRQEHRWNLIGSQKEIQEEEL
jgi:hypothetical protein